MGCDDTQGEVRVKEEDQQIVRDLVTLFSQIDINGDGSMQWDEWSTFIIDSSRHREQFRVDSVKKYYSSTDIVDSSTHASNIENVVYIEPIDKLVVLEKESKDFKVYDASSAKHIATVN